MEHNFLGFSEIVPDNGYLQVDKSDYFWYFKKIILCINGVNGSLWVQKWIILKRFGSPPKIIIILKSLHKNVNVKFTVGKVTQILSSMFGVKQGGILDPKLF